MVKIVVVMGGAGSGKTTVGAMLADAMRCAFLEGDSLHSAATVEKMSNGISLTDADRAPWLAAIHAVRSPGYISKALRRSFDRGCGTGPAITMKADMLASQFEALEEPSDALIVDVSQSPGAIVEQILAELRAPTYADMAGSTDRRKSAA